MLPSEVEQKNKVSPPEKARPSRLEQRQEIHHVTEMVFFTEEAWSYEAEPEDRAQVSFKKALSPAEHVNVSLLETRVKQSKPRGKISVTDRKETAVITKKTEDLKKEQEATEEVTDERKDKKQVVAVKKESRAAIQKETKETGVRVSTVKQKVEVEAAHEDRIEITASSAQDKQSHRPEDKVVEADKVIAKDEHSALSQVAEKKREKTQLIEEKSKAEAEALVSDIPSQQILFQDSCDKTPEEDSSVQIQTLRKSQEKEDKAATREADKIPAVVEMLEKEVERGRAAARLPLG
ncbi:uncharacterized protein LOC133486531 isoform X2 [Phyllopteryx taeniolatus]|uniref:uncharacterized protein LOC133486531 isoform X2 n=1 Tax=Phyllopteryx taeniolatus TaxID=161469 RepID=UPI002AD39684|nr:uncharacterized protein LOC133486531 isoform X2 [Phyllopteryx taeniolatus]